MLRNRRKKRLDSKKDSYYEIIANFYKGSEKLIKFIKQGEEILKTHFNVPNIETKYSLDKNLIIKFGMKDGLLAILGLVSKAGKLKRSDVKTLKNWAKQAVEFLENGGTILSSANKFSEPFLKRIIKVTKRKGILLNVRKEKSISLVTGEEIKFYTKKGELIIWNNYIITPKL